MSTPQPMDPKPCPLCEEYPETLHGIGQGENEPHNSCRCVNDNCLIVGRPFFIENWNDPWHTPRSTPAGAPPQARPAEALRKLLDYLDKATPTPRTEEIEVTTELMDLMGEGRAVLAVEGAGAPQAPDRFDFIAHYVRQMRFSEFTFGPGRRTEGIADHIRKELEEVKGSQGSPDEWVDVVILALDGFWRSILGSLPATIRNCELTAQIAIDKIIAKQAKNESRKWPDWRTMSANKAIEHDRSAEPTPTLPGSSTAPDPIEAALGHLGIQTGHWNVEVLHGKIKRITGRLYAPKEAAQAGSSTAPDPRPDAERGIYEKYRVTRTDGSSAPGGKHAGCHYYVLDLVHDRHALPALLAYAKSCGRDYPQLSNDLRAMAFAMTQQIEGLEWPEEAAPGSSTEAGGLDLEAMDAFIADVCQNGGQHAPDMDAWCEKHKALWARLRSSLAGSPGGVSREGDIDGDTLLRLAGDLARAEKQYRQVHDVRGEGHAQTGRAWDIMRHAGDRLRDLIDGRAPSPSPEGPGQASPTVPADYDKDRDPMGYFNA